MIEKFEVVAAAPQRPCRSFNDHPTADRSNRNESNPKRQKLGLLENNNKLREHRSESKKWKRRDPKDRESEPPQKLGSQRGKAREKIERGIKTGSSVM